MEITVNRCGEPGQARHAELVRTLCSIVAELLDSQFDNQVCSHCGQPGRGETQSDGAGDDAPNQEISLPMIFAEFSIAPRQVLMLRRRGGFPSPYRKRHRLMFRRVEVERWIADQPNPFRPADMLKRPLGKPIRSVRTLKSSPILHG